MKRGLVVLDPAAIPEAEWRARVAAVQERIRAAGAGVAFVYGDVFRSDDIAFLTNLTVYWNEAVLAVPADGEPALMTKLSARVHEWMQATSTLRDLRSGPSLVRLIGTYLEERPAPAPIALADRDWWPADVADGIAGLGDVVDVPDLVRGLRLAPGSAERAELARAAAIAAEAVSAAAAGERPEHERVAVVERRARDQGAKDVVVACNRLADGTVTVDALIQVGTVWARDARIAEPGEGGPSAEGLRAALDAAAAALTPGATAAVARNAAGAAWQGDHGLRIVQHADLATGGELRPASDAGLELPAGAVVAIVAETAGADGRAALAGMYEIASEGAAALHPALEEAR